jgi:hypothetical protein
MHIHLYTHCIFRQLVVAMYIFTNVFIHKGGNVYFYKQSTPQHGI